MKKLLSFAALCAALAGGAQAQSVKVSNPDILGVGFQTRPEEALALLKKKYPKLSYTTTKREIMHGTAYLRYDAMYDIVLEANPNGAVITQDLLHLNFLPDGALIGMRRVIVFKSQKQTTVDVLKSLMEKFGDPVFHAEGSSSQAGEMQWSDKIKPGLVLVGSQYRQAGAVFSADPGITPYPSCRSELTQYTDEVFNPWQLYKGVFHNPGYGPMWKECGTVADILFYPDSRLTFYANRIELRIANVSAAPELVAKMPELMEKNPAIARTVPASSLPAKPISAPGF